MVYTKEYKEGVIKEAKGFMRQQKDVAKELNWSKEYFSVILNGDGGQSENAIRKIKEWVEEQKAIING